MFFIVFPQQNGEKWWNYLIPLQASCWTNASLWPSRQRGSWHWDLRRPGGGKGQTTPDCFAGLWSQRDGLEPNIDGKNGRMQKAFLRSNEKKRFLSLSRSYLYDAISWMSNILIRLMLCALTRWPAEACLLSWRKTSPSAEALIDCGPLLRRIKMVLKRMKWYEIMYESSYVSSFSIERKILFKMENGNLSMKLSIKKLLTKEA